MIVAVFAFMLIFMFVLTTRSRLLCAGLTTAAALHTVEQHGSCSGIDIDDAARQAYFVSNFALEADEFRFANQSGAVGSSDGNVARRFR